ncbi:MAG: lysostaphin resistance A-like protein [Gemmatimonas sp.]
MDSVNPENAAAIVEAPRERRVFGFWGTLLWGCFVFAAMFVGQITVVGYVVLQKDAGISLKEAIQAAAGNGTTIAMSVIMGLPAVAAALWLAIRFTSTPFADYLALRRTSWKNLLIGVIGLVALLAGWEVMSDLLGHESSPGFMSDVVTSTHGDGAFLLLIFAFCVAAPVSEELFARGFLYRGWSETALGPIGAIVLSSIVWTSLHLQYGPYFFAEVFTLGLWFGYLRYRSGSTWLTIVLHGLNNLGAVVQTIWLAGHG